MKLIPYSLALWAILSAVQLYAQSYTLTGYIQDGEDRQALAGALVSDTYGNTCSTNESGYFALKTSRPTGQLQVSLMGYQQQTLSYEGTARPLTIQLAVDTRSLSEVRVSGFGATEKANRETAGAIARIGTAEIRQGSGVSLQTALNSVPGVKMDQSTLSESRIAIRGNGVRASWGIRNIKMYVNDIPITEADGTSRIEALDVQDVGWAEIIKGPASSIYGGGTGGVINFQLQRAPYQERSLAASSLIGSYGLGRLAGTYRSGGDQINSYISYGWQTFDGHRQHSQDMRRFLTGNFQFFPSDKQQITLLLNRSTQRTQIPGSLSAEQLLEDRRQANPSNLDKDAGRRQNWTRIGVGQQYRFNEQFSNSSSVFTYSYDLDHPLPYAYIRNYYQSYGGRTRFTYDPTFQRFATTFVFGGEFNQANTKGTQYVNERGTEGALRSNTDYNNRFYSLFYQSETKLAAHTVLALGINYSSLEYNVHDYLNPEKSGIKKFRPQASPRIALSHRFGPALSLHASVSSGYSPPSSSEIQDVDGAINKRVQAEKGINYELNAKGSLLQSKFTYDLALFRMNMKGELIAQSVQQGITVYHNAGRTRHQGVELALSYLAIQETDKLGISLLRPYVALTYAHFRFRDYKILDESDQIKVAYDGNDLTGIAPWVVYAGIQLDTRSGFYANASYVFNDKLPLDDGNSAYNPAYQLLNSKIGYRWKLGRHLAGDCYAGLDNITASRYNAMTSLNAVSYTGGSPAYFSPSPGRNGYGGLSIKYLF